TAGPLARTVADAVALLEVLVGMDPRDPATAAAPTGLDLRDGLDGVSLEGIRIGVARNMAGFHDRVDAVLEDAIQALRDLGAEVIDPADVPHATELEDPELEVLLFEFKADLEAYLGGLGGEVPRTLAELIDFNERHRRDEMPLFGQELLVRANEKGPLSDPAYVEALATCRRLSRDEGIDAVINEHSLDALVAPSGGPAWITDPVNGDHYVGGNTTPAAVAGYPTVCVPAGSAFGLPVGVSFIGRAWSEPTLIRVASAFERATGHRRPPTFATHL
ncbi:MAG TPA: amidase family protein, partial [Actinomycetota bacterium]|nr:amidase family protein [Actinomycetota bacterium]